MTMNDGIKVWGWGELAIHHVWLELKYDPEADPFHSWHATVFDADGVSGVAYDKTAIDAAAIAHSNQKFNRMACDRRDE